MTSQIVYVAADLRIAELLADGPKTSADLAEAAGADPSSLYRLMRGLVCLGLAAENEPDGFGLTAMGALLHGDHPDSVRNIILLFCGGSMRANWGVLADCVRTGKPGFDLLQTKGPFEEAADDPVFAQIFHEAMSEGTRHAAPIIAAAYDFTSLRTIADVGGGDGTLIAAILAVNPTLRGMLVDLPEGLAAADERLRAADVRHRCETVPCDFFEMVPPGADAYLMKHVIHDWDDVRATAILRNCRQAMRPDGRLLILETVVPSKLDWSFATRAAIMGDLNMLSCSGGRERTEAEFAALLRDGGFRLSRTVPVPAASLAVIEASPA